MTEIRHSRRQAGRVVYPTSYCPQSFSAMKSIQRAIETASGVEFSLSVIARALGLMTAQGVPTTDSMELLSFCRYCASKGRKRNRGRSAHE